MSTPTTDSCAADLAHLGLDMVGARGSVVVSDRLETPMGTLHGGAALGLAVAAMESVTDLGAVWATAQFVGLAGHGDRLDVELHVLARGRTSTQVHVVATGERGLVFQAMGATGTGRSDIPERTFPVMPDVSGPFEYAESELPMSAVLQGRGHLPTLEYRRAPVHDGLCLWIRSRDHVASRPAMLSLIADYLPLSIMVEAGIRNGGGTSLDNTIRFGPRIDSDWVLVDCRADAIDRGYGHGTVHLWSPGGDLLGIASQTSMQRLIAAPNR